MILLAYRHGFRASELVELRVGDVDLKRRDDLLPAKQGLEVERPPDEAGRAPGDRAGASGRGAPRSRRQSGRDGTCARNIVLLGDQMQLGQPVQGVHRGARATRRWTSCSTDGDDPPDRGIFLDRTGGCILGVRVHLGRGVRRASAAGAEKANSGGAGRDAHPALRPTGVVFVPVAHDGCSQRSDEEAELVAALYRARSASVRDREAEARDGARRTCSSSRPTTRRSTCLKRTLPDDARVGTVDKFQGQEAGRSSVSMTTSSEDDLPRHIEFLFSKNRLNVAISRARCLAHRGREPGAAGVGADAGADGAGQHAVLGEELLGGR